MIKSVVLLWETEAVLGPDVINNTTLWMNPSIKIPIKREWLNKGINTIANFLGPIRYVIPMSELISELFLLEYNSIIMKI